MALGKIERVNLREVWNNEATDFTPWLAQQENLDALSEVLGMDLETVAIEQFVGPFRADLLCKDAYTQATVLIENQLEKTNHSHLGQILTYGAGLNVKTIIWIASKFTDEHRAALDWLNEATDEGYSFFGIEIELLRIGSSEPAPQFKIISQPNTWSKNIRETAQHTGELTGAPQQQLAYWTAFKEYVRDKGSLIRLQKPLPQHWTNIAIGRSNFALCARVNTLAGSISADLNINEKTKVAYHALYAQKAEIETEFGGALIWNELPQKIQSIISVTNNNANIMIEAEWEKQFDWLIDKLDRLDKVFRKRVRELQLEE
ncbi:Domain of unknown function DUF4268 [Burkholderiaceae bacterium]